MEKAKIMRESNFELMRITSMFFIIIYHIILHICSIYSYDMSTLTNILLKYIIAIVIVHVNSFVIVTGYFQCEKKCKMSKVLSLNNAVWFYGILFLIVALVLRDKYNFSLVYPISNLDVFKTILPLDFGNYWFIDCYFILYLLTPILNKIISSYNQKGFLKIIIGLTILFSIIPTITVDGVIYTKAGHSIANFILLYFIGAYLKLYPINNSKLLSKLSNTANRTIYIVMFFSLAFITVLFYTMSRQLVNTNENEIVHFFSDVFFNFYNSFGSPIIILQSIVYFLFFSTIHIKSRIINKISTTVFGIYLIHENIHVRDNLYGLIPTFNVTHFGFHQIIMVFIIAFIIFFICSMMEVLRQSIYKFIYKRKISSIIRNKIKDYFKSINININW